MNRHILFYSNRCQHSKEFIQLLYKTSNFEKFQLFCVDDPKVRIPQGITSVPTIIVPRYPRPMCGEEVFMWLQGIVQMQQASTEQQSGGQGQNTTTQRDGGWSYPQSSNQQGAANLVESNGPRSEQMGGLEAYSPAFGGWSDNYSFLGDNPEPLSHSYDFIGGAPGMVGGGGGGGGRIPLAKDGILESKNGKADELNKQLEKLQQSRNFGM